MKEYPKEYAKDFIKKSEIFLEIARKNLDLYPEESAFNATQSIINTNDAFTVYTINKRATKDHREALFLHKEAIKKIGDSSKLDIVQKGLELRESTEYDVRKTISKNDAEILVKKEERFLNWVKTFIK